MAKTFDKLTLFFDEIKTISWWDRVVRWSRIRRMSYDAYDEFNFLRSFGEEHSNCEEIKNSLTISDNDKFHLKQSIVKLEGDINLLRKEKQDLEKINNQFQQIEEDRKEQYKTDIASLNLIRQQIQDDRKIETDLRREAEDEERKSMNKTWLRHEKSVEDEIKIICKKNTIEYVDKVPFKGKPDNTIKIGDEFVIFDAKSPASEDLGNFRNYVKSQTEKLAKYIKEENVKKDIFLVIPSNTFKEIDKFCYNLANYNVYVIAKDSLEPIILCFKKIETYEFLEQFSPEEKENISRIIANFNHTVKRKIQIDHYLIEELLAVITKCEKDIPKSMLDEVKKFEKSEKLNASQERRGKQILTSSLKEEQDKIGLEIAAKGMIPSCSS